MQSFIPMNSNPGPGFYYDEDMISGLRKALIPLLVEKPPIEGNRISSRYPSNTAVKVLSLGTFLEIYALYSLPFTLFLLGINMTFSERFS